MGEIEDIKNYLRGELKDHSIRFLTVNEREVVNEVETEDNRTTETATQQRSSMKLAPSDKIGKLHSVGLDARVKTDGQYGPTKVSTDVGFQYSSTTGEASRTTAAEFSTDVLQKSVEEVRDRELTRITTRTKTELEEIRDHKVDNIKGAGHLIGIYRWVNSRWKATTYGVGLRLVLEFLIPEPGRRVLLSRQPVPAGADATARQIFLQICLAPSMQPRLQSWQCCMAWMESKHSRLQRRSLEFHSAQPNIKTRPVNGSWRLS